MQTSLRRTIAGAGAFLALMAFTATTTPGRSAAATDTTPAPIVNPPDSSSTGPAVGARPKARTHRRGETLGQHIDELHRKLQISSAQEPLWGKFTQVMRDNERDSGLAFKHRVETIPTMSAAENMQSYAQVAAAHAQGMQRLVPAFQALYDTMSDKQKKVADQTFRDDSHHGRRAQHG